ncbi:MAG TPA: hypothetical protein VLI67_00480, partial [Vicinamibacteria bacterium]|nr:hypothetical protein [Vicinamibacteria bacterium]
MPPRLRPRATGLALLDLRPGEVRSASLMLAHSFAMGLSTVLFETAASALFLARFGAGALPWVYLAAAAVSTVTGVAYASAQRRLSFRALMAGTVAFLLSSVAGLRLGLALSEAAWLTFVLLVWYRVLSILSDLEYWAVASRLYDVRQAKRLFGFIGSGEVVARIAGALAVPLLLERVDVRDLVLLSALALAACLGLVLAVLAAQTVGAGGSRGDTPAGAARGGPDAPPPLRALLAHPYLRLLFALAFFGVLGKYFVDFAFLEQMRARHADTRSLASFFALFSGVSQASSLLARLLLSGRLLARYGVRVGLLVLPLSHLACTALIVGAGAGLGGAETLFWLVVANQGIYKTLKHPIESPSFKILFLPLRREERLAAQVAVETLVTPFTIGLAGGVMLLFSAVIPYHPARFALVLLLAFAGWAALALRAGRRYAGALMRALRSRVADEVAFSASDPESLAILRRTLASRRPEDVLFALDLVERGQPEALEAALFELLEHPAPEVRRAALLRIERLRPPGAREAVALRIEREAPGPVLAAALRCAPLLDAGAARARVEPYLEHADAEVRRGALVGLLRADDPDARRRLAALAASADPAKRAEGARVAGEVGEATPPPNVLDGLLRDPAPEVRRAALASAARVMAPERVPAVAHSLTDPRFARLAAAA